MIIGMSENVLRMCTIFQSSIQCISNRVIPLPNTEPNSPAKNIKSTDSMSDLSIVFVISVMIK